MYALEIKDLKKNYGQLEALKGVSFEVKKGDFFALLGPNGAGKATLIGILTSLVMKTSGSVKIFGHDIDNEFSLAKAKIGLVPQEFNFGIFDSVENILRYQAGYYGVPWKIAKIRIEKYLKQLGLWDKRKAQARFLSGGMKRRLIIVRALLHEPQMLILDEPTAGVDIELRRSMWDFLLELNKNGTTVILTTHYLEEAESLCRNVAIIDEGNLIKNCSIASLLRELEKESFIFYLRTPLEKAPHISGYTLKLQDECTLEVEVSKSHALSDLFVLLKEHGVIVDRMRNKSNRLEELFLRLTTEEPHDA